jgi:hypothetical protein
MGHRSKHHTWSICILAPLLSFHPGACPSPRTPRTSFARLDHRPGMGGEPPRRPTHFSPVEIGVSIVARG